MKLPPNYGSVSKLSGKRRKPYCVRLTVGYQTDFELQRTKQIRKVLGYYATKKEAMQALAAYNDNPFDLENAKITFRQCYEEAKKEFSQARAHNYRSAFRYLEEIADLPIRSIKAGMMQKCIDSCTTTQQREIKTVCHKVYEYALRNEIVDRNPSQYLKSNTVAPTIDRELFTSEEISYLWDHRDEWFCRVALILLYEGMRTKELRTLQPDQIDLDARMIRLTEGKNKASIRDIPIHDAVFSILSDFKSEPIHFTHNGLNKALKRLGAHTAHDTRHTFTSRMRECGAELLPLKLILGHTPDNITERVYTHLSEAELLRTINLLDYECVLPLDN